VLDNIPQSASLSFGTTRCDSVTDGNAVMLSPDERRSSNSFYYAIKPPIFVSGVFVLRRLIMNKTKTNYLIKVGLLSAIAFVLQVIGSMMSLKVAGFLEIEFSDLPAIIGALSLGPVAGVLIEFIKNLFHMMMSSTGFVGEFANFVVNGTFVLVIGIFYKLDKTKKGAIIALLMGSIVMPIAAALINYLVMLPLYMPAASHAVKFNLVLTTITPFNFVRAIVLSIITIFCYKRISPILHK